MRICMIYEGSYPYVNGGVSSWANQYIRAMNEHEFVLWCIGADHHNRDKFKFSLPDNVVDVEQVFLDQAIDVKKSSQKLDKKDLDAMKGLIFGEKTDWNYIFYMFQEKRLSPTSVMMSAGFLEAVKQVCKEKYPYIPFVEYFHTVRSMLLPELYLMMGNVPMADIYHATATGYSGILGSLGKWKYHKPFVLTEHGIYTREREEELIRASWVLPEFRKQWVKLFYHFSDCAYENADRVTSLFEGASHIQEHLGCVKNKLMVIGNGIHYERYENIPPKASNGFIDIGAVVRIAKIKDIKTMIYAFTQLHSKLNNVRLYIMGDVDDSEYMGECETLIEMLGVRDIIFTGIVDTIEYMAKFDFTILTSISEGQPLSVLESFAAARPVVVTDVGCCRELVSGKKGDDIGEAGIVVPPLHPKEFAAAMERLCLNETERNEMGENGRKRVLKYYTHEMSMDSYKKLYKAVI